MKRALLLLVVVLVLIAGGYISQTISQKGVGAVPGVLIQTNNPEASVLAVTPDKGALFFLFAGFVLTSVIIMGVVFMLIFWLGNMQIERAKKLPNQAFDLTNLNPAGGNTLGSALTRYPVVTALVAVVVLIIVAVGIAITSGVFSR